jgi:hypothetical protein
MREDAHSADIRRAGLENMKEQENQNDYTIRTSSCLRQVEEVQLVPAG